MHIHSATGVSRRECLLLPISSFVINKRRRRTIIIISKKIKKKGDAEPGADAVIFNGDLDGESPSSFFLSLYVIKSSSPLLEQM